MAREPASIRYKNPGAMWGNALARKWGANKKAVGLNDGTGQNNNIAVFPTFVQGICAQLDLWRTSKNYRNKPFSKAIAIWSGGNHVEEYIAFVLKRVPGMGRNTVLDDTFWRSRMAIPFLKAQAWHEAGKPYPAPEQDWQEAWDIVMNGSPPQRFIPEDQDEDETDGELPDEKKPWYKRLGTWVSGTLLGGGLATWSFSDYFFAFLGVVAVLAFFVFLVLWFTPEGRKWIISTTSSASSRFTGRSSEQPPSE